MVISPRATPWVVEGRSTLKSRDPYLASRGTICPVAWLELRSPKLVGVTDDRAFRDFRRPPPNFRLLHDLHFRDTIDVRRGLRIQPRANTISTAVVIPVYNRAEILIDALNSVADQNRLPERVIVVDDGSNDTVAYRLDAISPLPDITFGQGCRKGLRISCLFAVMACES